MSCDSSGKRETRFCECSRDACELLSRLKQLYPRNIRPDTHGVIGVIHHESGPCACGLFHMFFLNIIHLGPVSYTHLDPPVDIVNKALRCGRLTVKNRISYTGKKQRGGCLNVKLKEKIRESLSAVLPITGIVLLLSSVLIPLEIRCV